MHQLIAINKSLVLPSKKKTLKSYRAFIEKHESTAWVTAKHAYIDLLIEEERSGGTNNAKLAAWGIGELGQPLAKCSNANIVHVKAASVVFE